MKALTNQEIFECQRDIANTLRLLLIALPPDVAQGILGGCIGNAIGPLPEEFWRAMVHQSHQPCDQVDCGCETFRGKVMDALTLLREDWLEQMRG